MRLGIPNVTGTQEPQEWARELRALGCGCVVLPVGADDSLHKVREYARCAREQGLNIAEVWSWCNPVAPDEQERRNAIETCRVLCECGWVSRRDLERGICGKPFSRDVGADSPEYSENT